MKNLLMASLAAVALSTEAGPITFNNAAFDLNAIAVVATGPAGFDSQSSPPSATPVIASAVSVGATDIATAAAIGDLGSLSTSADVSASGIANAIATAHFVGSFELTAAESVLSLDFTPLDVTAGTGMATTSLFVTLSSGGMTLFQDFVSGPWSSLLTPGTTYLLDLTLASDASVGSGGRTGKRFQLRPSNNFEYSVSFGLGACELGARWRRSRASGLYAPQKDDLSGSISPAQVHAFTG